MYVGIFFIDFCKIIKNNYYFCKSRKKIHINNKEGKDESPITKKTKKIIRYMKNVMEMCMVKMPENKNNANVKITATSKYLTYRDGCTGKVIGKIAKGEGCISEYDEDNNVTNIYTSGDARCDCGQYGAIYEYKIDMSEPDFVIHGDLHDVELDFFEENRKVTFVGKSCYIMNGNHFLYSDTCSVYCGK